MLFHTWLFLIFMLIVLPVFFALRGRRWWNPWLLVISLLLCGWWNSWHLMLLHHRITVKPARVWKIGA